MHLRSVALSLVSLLTLAPPGAMAQSVRAGVEPNVPEKAGKEIHAFRISGPPPVVDGILDDDVWSKAQGIDDFVQIDPDNLAPPSERTVIRVAYDDRYFYVGAWCFTRDPATLMTGLARRGNLPNTDWIGIGIDSRHDHRSAYAFRVNPSGVMDDMAIVDDGRSDPDFDAVWEVKTSISKEGWFAEYRIPFSQVRFEVPPTGGTVWGFHTSRRVQKRGENDYWVANQRGSVGIASRYGHLTFDGPLKPPRRLEISPFVLGRVEQTPAKSEFGAGTGADLRVGLGSAFTVAATVNPDFGQVEQDPAVLNLSVFEQFFPERRPFFLEDSRVFALSPFGQFPDFYSRRIGQRPGRVALRTGDTLVSQPDTTTILGAAKLTGRKGQWTYGGLTALTSEEFATVDAATTGASGQPAVARVQRLIEPRSLYSVGRVQRDLKAGASTLGLLATNVTRDGVADATTGGGDVNVRWGGNRYLWNTHWVGTRTPITGAVKSGVGGASNFSYDGKYLNYNAHYDHFGRNFRNTDLGFLTTRTDKNEVTAGFDIGQPDPRGLIRKSRIGVSVLRQWNGNGLVFGNSVSMNGNVTFDNFWNVFGFFDRDFDTLDDLDTRGGPPIFRLADNFYNFGLNSDSRKRWGIHLTQGWGRNAAGNRQVMTSATVRLQPSSRLTSSVSANYTSATDAAQWITNTDADRDGVTDHVYGTLRRQVMNVTGRSTFAFTRDLTLEAFLQPFVAAGDYTGIRKLARANSFEFSPVALTSDSDFNRKSLRGTVVLRWEYIRGSTLFVVWNRTASDLSRPGTFSPWRDIGDTFSAPGTNVLAVKLTRWLAP